MPPFNSSPHALFPEHYFCIAVYPKKTKHMKTSFTLICILLLSSVFTFGQRLDESKGVILKLKHHPVTTSQAVEVVDGTGNAPLDQISRSFGALKVERRALGKGQKQCIYVVKFPNDSDIERIIAAYYATGALEYAEPDHKGYLSNVQQVVPNDLFHAQQWAMHNNGSFTMLPSTPGADINMQPAWAIEQGSSDLVVAIIDTGINPDHPDLVGRHWRNPGEMPGNGIDDDNNGYIDDLIGWDFVNNTRLPIDDHGHGTAVTGVIGANGNNAIGIAGIDWNCKLMTLKAFNHTVFGLYSWWASAFYYAADNGANVINISGSGFEASIALQEAVNYALSRNVTVVASIGNQNAIFPRYPAAFPGVIAVGATNPNDSRCNPFHGNPNSGSNFGPHISVTAPGNLIATLHLASATEVIYASGTSFSAPMVTGLAALLLAQDGTRTPEQIKYIIESTADDQVGPPAEDTPGWDPYFGHGRINAFRALSFAPVSVEEELGASAAFSIFPNPGAGQFTLSFPMPASRLEVFNATGQKVLDKPLAQVSEYNLFLADPGLYLVVSYYNGGGAFTRKLLVRR